MGGIPILREKPMPKHGLNYTTICIVTQGEQK
nr:MAG TPA_asm: hypothetical protein [Bacteriophage sp.]